MLYQNNTSHKIMIAHIKKYFNEYLQWLIYNKFPYKINEFCFANELLTFSV